MFLLVLPCHLKVRLYVPGNVGVMSKNSKNCLNFSSSLPTKQLKAIVHLKGNPVEGMAGEVEAPPPETDPYTRALEERMLKEPKREVIGKLLFLNS